MLKSLLIKDLAVVANVSLEFDPGLNVLTGSTGAGKSLILGAVNLLLGHKSPSGAIRAGADEAVVGGVLLKKGALASSRKTGLLAGLEAGRRAGAEMSVRREIRRNGRSYAFVDDEAVPLKELQRVCAACIEPHGQNEQLRLRDRETHSIYVDAFAQHDGLVDEYKSALEQHRASERSLSEFDRELGLLREREELLRHRVDEITRAALREGELSDIEAKIRLMENAERVYEALTSAYATLEGDDGGTEGVVMPLARAEKELSRLADMDRPIAEAAARLAEAEVSLRDCAESVRRYLDRFQFDPDELRLMRDRRAHLLDLERRYGVPVDDLIAMCADWERQLESITFEDKRRRELTAVFEQSCRELRRAADELRASRREAAARLDERMTKELADLMMPGASFRTAVEFERADRSPVSVDGIPVVPRADGIDVIRFMVRTNPGETEGPLDEIASSGEVSRISLALKKTIQEVDSGTTLVFDEVDAGVGADLGGLIAEKLLELSAKYQIICITHMPQIAAIARRHLVVSKKTTRGRTYVEVHAVEGEQRRREIARMLGGDEGSDKRMALAGELLGGGRKRRPPNVRP